MTVKGNEKIDVSFEEKKLKKQNHWIYRFHKTTLKRSNLQHLYSGVSSILHESEEIFQ